jgi:hypothetical protein
MLNVANNPFMLSVIMLIIVMLSVVAPLDNLPTIFSLGLYHKTFYGCN